MKVISFSLFNPPMNNNHWSNPDLQVYIQGAIENTQLSNVYFPEWTCRIYIGSNIDKNVVKQLEKCGAETIEMEHDRTWLGTCWRFLPIQDPDVDVFISRDIDARLNSRDAWVVNQWLETDKTYHIIRDHPGHRWEMLAGLWGAKNFTDEHFFSKIDQFYSTSDPTFQTDQMFLSHYYHKYIDKSDVLVHSDFYGFQDETVMSINQERDPVNMYLGMSHERDQLEHARINSLRSQLPAKFRTLSREDSPAANK